MTRLTAEDTFGLGQGLALYEEELLRKTGRTLRQVACRAARIDEEALCESLRQRRVGVVSTTAGQGVISGFAEAVRGIISHLGFKAFVPEETDVAGFAAAIEEGADVIFMADDVRFVAVNLSTRRVVDNAEATGRGYGAALEGMAGSVCGRRVLVIGAGRVGTGAARLLREMGAEMGICDPDSSRAQQLANEVRGVVEADLEQALHAYPLVVDASPASGIIEARHIQSGTLVAAPGIPLGLTAEAEKGIGNRLIHDPLQIGVATMMILAVKP